MVDRSLIFKQSEVGKPNFFLDQIFSTKKLFKEVVNSHGVKTGKCLFFQKKDGRRIYARCNDEGCDWGINALKPSMKNTTRSNTTTHHILVQGPIM